MEDLTSNFKNILQCYVILMAFYLLLQKSVNYKTIIQMRLNCILNLIVAISSGVRIQII